MDLGIQIPQKINLLSCALLRTLSFPHVLRAGLSLSDPGWCPQPTGGTSPASSQGSSPQHPHLRYLHNSGVKPRGRSQTQGQNERCMERHQAETQMVSVSLTKTLRERQ